MSVNTRQERRTVTGKANRRQPGGDHYKKYGDLQPWDVTAYFNLGFFDGNAVKYLLRWRDKGGLLDLQKATHYIEKLIELETANAGRKSSLRKVRR